MKNTAVTFLKKYWPAIAVLLIIALGVGVRMTDYHWGYLRNIDSYNFARQINEIAQNGHLLPRDALTMAPYGVDRVSTGQEFYVYLAGYFLRFLDFVKPGLSLFQFLLWFPPLLIALTAVPLYFIGKMLYDRRAGVLAAFFFVFDTSIMGRTLGGDPDSDGIVLIMPLIAMALFLLAYKYASEKNKIDKNFILYTILSGIGMAAWGYTWSGFWFLIWLITGFIVLGILINFARLRDFGKLVEKFKYKLIVFVGTMLIFFLLTVPILGTGIITGTVYGPISFNSIKSEDNSMFPNVYVSVAELQSSGGVKDIIQRTSAINFDQNPLAMMISPFFLMIYGLIYLLYSYIKKGQHLDTLLILLIWFGGPFLATVVAVRFSILFSAPIAIGSAILLAKIARTIQTGEKLDD